MMQKDSVAQPLFNTLYSLQRVEENLLTSGGENILTLNEIHIIETIGLNKSKSMGETAAALDISLGSMTKAADKLERKKYIFRVRKEDDRRVVLLSLTALGAAAHKMHERFHMRIADAVLEALNANECEILKKALGGLDNYLAILAPKESPYSHAES